MASVCEEDMEYKTLNNGLKMPMVGLGVYNISERETQRVVEDAISVGYRSIDTAAMYYNEKGVGVKHIILLWKKRNRYGIQSFE